MDQRPDLRPVGARHRSQAPGRDRTGPRRGWARARALLAAGVVVGVGAAATLASWTDTEWVWAGNGSDDGPGLAASIFEVQQNLWDGADGAANFVDRETAPGGQLDFTLDAGRLTPGDTVYAPMQLRTIADSDAAELTLDGAVLGSGTTAFFEALRYGVRTDVPRAACTAAGYGSAGAQLVPPGTVLATGSGSATFALDAGGVGTPGAAVDLCFAVTLPAGVSTTLQGQGAPPQWAFQGLSR
ncbi:SipW-dependent-type signal peptide-containing protein [Jannaschia sp. R86511]|uniref:SipW-dependent-type signal peptide-containing protein n=1 Tax=Jannaschia sp. R86511 TaxID=3093853 RepID=UPI0036D346E6